MPSTPYAQLLVAVAGGTPTSGGQTATAGDTLAFSFASTVGWGNPVARTQIYSFPSGFSCPAGWTATSATINGQTVSVYEYAGNTPPPSFALPAAPWFGKLLFRLIVLGGTSSALVDEASGVSVESANGIEDVAFLEAGQFDAVRPGGVGALQALVREVDTLASGGSGVTSVSGTAPIVSSGGATPAISISAASGTGPGSMSVTHWTLCDGATSAATASTLAKRDADGRMKAVAGVASDDVAVVSQLGGGWATGVEVADFGALTPQNIASGGDGSYTIAGKSWTATNTSHAAYLQLDAAGITGQANNGSADVMLSIPWATLAPAATLADHDVLILARLVRSTYSGVDNSSGMNLCFGFEPFSAGSDGGSGLPAKALLATVDTQGGTGLRNITQNYNWGTGQTGVWTGGDAATDVWVALYVAAGGRRFWGAIAAGGSTAPDPSDMVQMMAGVSTADTTGASGAWTPSASHLRLRWSDGGGGSKWSLRALKVVYK